MVSILDIRWSSCWYDYHGRYYAHCSNECNRPNLWMEAMNHYYEAVPGLGNVAVSRHAQDTVDKKMVSEQEFEDALLHPIREDIMEGFNVVWREKGGVRLIILKKPTPYKGACLVKTVFRIKEQEKV